MGPKIIGAKVKDVRFPTSLECDGSDAMHTDPDYSCAYVILKTDADIEGHGFTFTIGRGTEIVVSAIKALYHLVHGRDIRDIFKNFAQFWREMTSETQLRWLGPEKGVIHLATAAIINALWDAWAKLEKKPLWKLLVDMDPKDLVSTIDFRYIDDCITKEEAIELLEKKRSGKANRENIILQSGYPAYTTQIGWLGYEDEKLKGLCRRFLAEGFTMFKAKVGASLEDDKRRLKIIRQEIGSESLLMVDANQRWGVQESINWMTKLKEFNIHWIEEPTSPDDILGHATIAKALAPYGMGVATGEQCQNRVMFKQFIQAKAFSFCQIDSCRIGGVNEILSVYLMAAKHNVPVCPHAGGVGLCELVQHLAIWDYISLSGSLKDRVIEYVDHLHEHFVYPVCFKSGKYMPPEKAGYSTEMKSSSLRDYSYPDGKAWQELFASGQIKRPVAGWINDEWK